MTKSSFGFVVSLLILASCSPLYVPNTRHVPLLEKAGEVQIAGQYGTTGFDGQAAVAVTNHLAIMGDISYQDRNTDTTFNAITDRYHRHKFYEGAIGYFHKEGIFRFEVFVGMGKGETSSYGNYFTSNYSYHDQVQVGKFTRYIFQPSFGISKKVVTIAFTPRFSVLQLDRLYNPNTNTDFQISKSSKIFFEPAVTTRFNFMDNRMFASLQFGLNTPTGGDVYFNYVHMSFSTGFGVRLGGNHWEQQPPASK